MHRSTHALLAGLLAAVCTGAAAADDACLPAGGPVQALTGTLRSVDVYGAKRHGAKPAKDTIDRLTLLVLDQPSCVAATGQAPVPDVRALQVDIEAARRPALRALVGRHVAIDGAVRAAAGAGDRTAFVVEAGTVAEAPGGN